MDIFLLVKVCPMPPVLSDKLTHATISEATW